MDLQIEVNGRVRTVSIEPHGGVLRVVVDGKARLVDAAAVDGDTFSLVCLTNGNQSIQAGLAATALPGELAVHMANGVASVRILSGGAGRAVRGAGVPDTAGGTRKILAPMPGRIVKVLVKPGDAVTARQGLVVVEAMKMENELRSPRDGRVTEVLVAEGATVEAGRVLVVVE
jgi:biotin carboxyl carrier protein